MKDFKECCEDREPTQLSQPCSMERQLVENVKLAVFAAFMTGVSIILIVLLLNNL